MSHTEYCRTVAHSLLRVVDCAHRKPSGAILMRAEFAADRCARDGAAATFLNLVLQDCRERAERSLSLLARI